MPKKDHSTRDITLDLVSDILQALKNIKGWGSVEIFIQNFKVTQITERNIKKTNHSTKNI